MIKDHMRNPDNPKRTRCGQPTDKPHIKRIYAFEYGSPKATCKMCQRLYAKDLSDSAKDIVNCIKCRFSDPDNDYACSLKHAQIYTSYGDITVKIGYFASASGFLNKDCPDFKLVSGDDQ